MPFFSLTTTQSGRWGKLCSALYHKTSKSSVRKAMSLALADSDLGGLTARATRAATWLAVTAASPQGPLPRVGRARKLEASASSVALTAARGGDGDLRSRPGTDDALPSPIPPSRGALPTRRNESPSPTVLMLVSKGWRTRLRTSETGVSLAPLAENDFSMGDFLRTRAPSLCWNELSSSLERKASTSERRSVISDFNANMYSRSVLARMSSVAFIRTGLLLLAVLKPPTVFVSMFCP
mmetsp:Transcript_86639/g.242717  ORF Transcript_86639/g.242717 Transcript_86639/m.242717 type:complete len:238 (-) Transcript_86639:501-1214(-)